MNFSFDIIGVLMCSLREMKTFSGERKREEEKEKIVCIEPSMFQLVDGSSARRIENGRCSVCQARGRATKNKMKQKPNALNSEKKSRDSFHLYFWKNDFV